MIFLLLGTVISTIATRVDGEKTFEAETVYELAQFHEYQNPIYLLCTENDSESAYKYLANSSDGYELYEIEASKTNVVFSNEPKVEIGYFEYTNPVHNFLAGPVKAYKIYIPENSIEFK